MVFNMEETYTQVRGQFARKVFEGERIGWNPGGQLPWLADEFPDGGGGSYGCDIYDAGNDTEAA
jgi:hypothetical protein